MQVILLGAAGFIGSHVAEALLKRNHRVIGLDSFDSTLYSGEVKKRRIANLLAKGKLEFIEADLLHYPLGKLCQGADVVINEAALPGLSPSWQHFSKYLASNLEIVQRVLDAVSSQAGTHFIQASTSSVYGKSAVGDENIPLCPVSPYGVTKLAAEHLVGAYQSEKSLSASILRYFSVYGPEQRPDMGIAKFCLKLLHGDQIEVFGDGHQSRSGTFISDAVRATVLAAEMRLDGAVINVSGSESLTVRKIIQVLANELEVEPRLTFVEARPGDQDATLGDSSLAATLLGWQAEVGFEEGLRSQAKAAKESWLRERHE